ncbi:MAG: hypothetical protein ACPIOQ_77805, partial [Promethearchaeia archaeon]
RNCERLTTRFQSPSTPSCDMQMLAVAVAMMLQVVGGGGAAADRGAVLQAQRREAAAQLPPVHIFYYSWFGAPAFFDGSGSSFRGGVQ